MDRGRPLHFRALVAMARGKRRPSSSPSPLTAQMGWVVGFCTDHVSSLSLFPLLLGCKVQGSTQFWSCLIRTSGPSAWILNQCHGWLDDFNVKIGCDLFTKYCLAHLCSSHHPSLHVCITLQFAKHAPVDSHLSLSDHLCNTLGILYMENQDLEQWTHWPGS